MGAYLNLSSSAVAFGGSSPNANPSLKFVDWRRNISNISIDNPESKNLILQPGESRVIFDGTRTTTVASNTQLVLSLNPTNPSVYRFSQGTGTVPGFRTDRGLVTTSIVLTLVANDNDTMTVTAGSGSPFVSVVVGDTVFIPGISTGDSDAGFNVSNQGEWIVLGKTSSAILTLIRNGDFEGGSEVVTPSTDAILAYSSTGVQVGDKVEISAGFASSVQKTYEVLSVTSKWFEVVSCSPLASESAIPGIDGIAFYSNGKRFLRIESNQDLVIRVNGDTGNTNKINPILVDGIGYFEKTGLTFSLSLISKSPVPLNATIISAE